MKIKLHIKEKEPQLKSRFIHIDTQCFFSLTNNNKLVPVKGCIGCLNYKDPA